MKQINIYDIDAHLCMEKDINDNIHVLDVSSFAKGVYTLEIITKSETLHKKLIVQ